jgi:hypothetical protein
MGNLPPPQGAGSSRPARRPSRATAARRRRPPDSRARGPACCEERYTSGACPPRSHRRTIGNHRARRIPRQSLRPRAHSWHARVSTRRHRRRYHAANMRCATLRDPVSAPSERRPSARSVGGHRVVRHDLPYAGPQCRRGRPRRHSSGQNQIRAASISV